MLGDSLWICSTPISLHYGLRRETIFECYAILIAYLVLVVNGILLSRWFRRVGD